MYMKIHSCCTHLTVEHGEIRVTGQRSRSRAYEWLLTAPEPPAPTHWKTPALRVATTWKIFDVVCCPVPIRPVINLVTVVVVDWEAYRDDKTDKKTLRNIFVAEAISASYNGLTTSELWTRLLCFFFSFLQSPVSCCDDSWSERLWFYSPGISASPPTNSIGHVCITVTDHVETWFEQHVSVALYQSVPVISLRLLWWL